MNFFLPGQPLLLQDWVSWFCPAHSWPPNNEYWVIILFLSSVPPPHVTEQASQALHWLHVQFTIRILIQKTFLFYKWTSNAEILTRAAISVASFSFLIFPCTLIATIQCHLSDWSISFFCATSTSYRACYPCTPLTPWTIHYANLKSCHTTMICFEILTRAAITVTR